MQLTLAIAEALTEKLEAYKSAAALEATISIENKYTRFFVVVALPAHRSYKKHIQQFVAFAGGMRHGIYELEGICYIVFWQ